MERMRDSIIRFLQCAYFEAANIIDATQTACRASSESGRTDTSITEFLHHIGKNVLDSSQRCARELEGPFDLETVDGSELSENDKGADLVPYCQSKKISKVE